jgi:hypothetical protein
MSPWLVSSLTLSFIRYSPVTLFNPSLEDQRFDLSDYESCHVRK